MEEFGRAVSRGVVFILESKPDGNSYINMMFCLSTSSQCNLFAQNPPISFLLDLKSWPLATWMVALTTTLILPQACISCTGLCAVCVLTYKTLALS